MVEILVQTKNLQRHRRLTPRECARLQGFPDSFKIPVSDNQAYRQFGNSVTVKSSKKYFLIYFRLTSINIKNTHSNTRYIFRRFCFHFELAISYKLLHTSKSL